MPHTDAIPVSASIASTGKGIRYIGEYCYAYSGEVDVANTELALLEFTSGAGIIVCELQLGSKAAENEDYELKVYLNDNVVFAAIFGNQSQNEIGSWPIPLIIPPTTVVKTTLDNIADTDSRIWTIGLTGRVYGAE